MQQVPVAPTDILARIKGHEHLRVAGHSKKKENLQREPIC